MYHQHTKCTEALCRAKPAMMFCSAVLILLGSIFTIVHCVYPAGSCDGYNNISETWRNLEFTSSSFPTFPKSDDALTNRWWRFIGLGGDRIYTQCIHGNRAGSTYTIHLSDDSLPTLQSATLTTLIAYADVGSCNSHSIPVDVVLCPGGFYIYKPQSHPHPHLSYVTYHLSCKENTCGPLAQCLMNGGCICIPGFEIPAGHLPGVESYGCTDIDECSEGSVCGPYSNCTNFPGLYSCECLNGFTSNRLQLPPYGNASCLDIDECSGNNCGTGGTCHNTEGSYRCECHDGYSFVSSVLPNCQDIDECFNSTICGPNSICTNQPGVYSCICNEGFNQTQPDEQPSESNVCLDIDECDEDAAVCGPNANCTNLIGFYACTCFHGYRENNPTVIASVSNPCEDIDECSENPGLCGKQTVCTNAEGTYYCSCPDGFFPSTGILWIDNVSFCRNIQEILNEINPPEGQTKERAFLGQMDQQLQSNTGIILPKPTVANSFSASMEVSGAGPQAKSITVSSEGDGDMGSAILNISHHLVSAMVPADLDLETIGPGSADAFGSSLSANGNVMKINLEGLARNNNGSAAAAFLTLNGLEDLLSHRYFKSENQTEMISDVITAVLPVGNTSLGEPVNFTIRHKRTLPKFGLVTCVYWEDKTKERGEAETLDTGRDKDDAMYWSEDGCWVLDSNENFTVCSCSHLSTFALILQIGEVCQVPWQKPQPEGDFLEWLNRMCVIVGLFFFGLAILTFLLCSWNPKINNTARLHLCLSLALSHLLLLWNDRYLEDQLACTVIAGLLHFLIVASFTWMLLEAVQLHLLVRKLSRVQVIQRDGLPKVFLYLTGYGVPFVIVGVSALVFSDGYGATNADACWLSKERYFNWALTGPVITVLALNLILFCTTLWSLKPTLVNMRNNVSQSKDTKLVIFKILAQFVILGCTWILGLYQINLFFKVLFIILNSQQGTFLFIVHCLLNKEVREEYMKWLTCSFNKRREEGSVKDPVSVSEDWEKPEETHRKDER